MSAGLAALARRQDSAAALQRQEARDERRKRALVSCLPQDQQKTLLCRFAETEAAKGFNAAYHALRADTSAYWQAIENNREGFKAALRAARTRAGDARRLDAWHKHHAPDALDFNSTDDDVKDWARRRADEARTIATAAAGQSGGDCAAIYDELAAYCEQHGISAPEANTPRTVDGCTQRMQDAAFWRRRGRAALGLLIERAAIQHERIHRRAALYVSNDNFARWRAAKSRNAQALEGMAVQNEQGDLLGLDEVVASSLSNPALRRAELMTRARGMEDYARSAGYIALFFVMTLASRFHRMLWTGAANPKWTGQTPDDGSARLCALWARIRAKLAKKDAKYYGVRTTEPHHDGTPHWNLLIYAASEADAAMITGTIKHYAFKDDPDEAGAQRARLRIKRLQMDEQQSATGYIAKYICKQIDGFAVGEQYTPDDNGKAAPVGASDSAALRATAWASVWKIRQFQIIGTPPVTIYRELRRVREPVPHARIEPARAAADAGEYAEHVAACGGFACPRDAQQLALWREADDTPNRYGETRAAKLRGVRAAANDDGAALRAAPSVVTRIHTWTLCKKSLLLTESIRALANDRAAAVCRPWTRDNNCSDTIQASHLREWECVADPPRMEGVQCF